MKTLITLTIVFLTLSTTLNAQVSQVWASRYNFAASTDNCRAMTVDASGNVYVTGASRSGGVYTEDIATNKYNSSGTLIWSKRFVGTGYGEDIGNAIAVDGSGNVYVTGRTWTGTAMNNDIVTIKYNLLGDSLWVKKYNGAGSNHDEGFSVAVDAAGNVYVTGTSYGTMSGHGLFQDYITVKYNSAGVQLWANSYNGPGTDNDYAYSVAIDGTGNVYITGVSGGGSTGSGSTYDDYATIKYNSAGVFQWVARYTGMGSTGIDFAYQLKLDVSGNVYVTGKSHGTTSDYDYATIKYSTGGTLMWVSRYNGPGNSADEAYALAVDRTGNVYVTGKSYGGTSTMHDIATVKYNSLGVQQWASRFNGTSSANDEGKAITVDTSSNIYVTGYSTNPTTADDYETIKYNTAGVQQWEIKYTNGGSAGSQDEAASIYVDLAGNVYVTGMSALDYATVKYSPTPTGIEPNKNLTATDFSLEQNYPNPFNPSTNIRYSIVNGTNVRLSVYDITGKEVVVLVDEAQQKGTYEILFNASALSSGVYFYKLVTNEFSDVRRMSLVK
jgi:uncharacterized delta-60 repeat protein